MNKEQIIQNKIRVALGKHGMCFRTNSGKVLTGTRRWSNEFQQDVLTNIRAVELLPTGFSDTLLVGDGMVAFVEIKQPGEEPTDEQKHFLATMRAHGHIAGVAHSVEEALALVEGSEKPKI